MVWVGNVVLLAALSWLPSALIFGALWFLGSRIDAAPSRPWLPATAGLAGGFCLGLLILGPLAQHPLLIALVIVGVVIALLLAATRVAYRAPVAGGAAVVVGAHVAVFARAVGSETQDVFWAMPILDLWVILGVPLVLAVAGWRWRASMHRAVYKFLGWLTGLEPATPRITTWCSTS